MNAYLDSSVLLRVALHLATALIFREFRGESELAFATHDVTLGRAARTMGFAVIGTD